MGRLVITIDGPAGSGKSTTARKVAERLGLFYLDTGAMYRAIALKAVRLGYDPDSEGSIGTLAERTNLEFVHLEGKQRLMMDGEDVTDLIRTPDVTAAASAMSAIPRVREVLVERQRELGRIGKVVAEGRDTGSVVFPEADVKIYLIADSQVRAERRHLDMENMGLESTTVEQLEQIALRDDADSTRKISPLVKPEGAIEIDTTGLSIEEQVEKVVELARRAAPA
ncbi:MAG: (d)CMP kinase [bacterium]